MTRWIVGIRLAMTALLLAVSVLIGGGVMAQTN
ncbi:MAG: hypothetical protein K0Q71_2793, partial [Thermomicrobiales bacterium]|nr:hypothetical protein [Thermomicrobiales bacterium]